MKTIELTKEELEAFELIYDEQFLAEYLSFSESGKLIHDTYSSLFRKLGINVTGEENV